MSNILNEVDIAVVDFTTCNSAYNGVIVNDAMICAGANQKDSCQGDSGGPLLDQRGDLVGVVSFGSGWYVEEMFLYRKKHINF